MTKLRDISDLALAFNAVTPAGLPVARASSAAIADRQFDWQSIWNLNVHPQHTWTYQPHVSSTDTDSLAAFYASLLPPDPRIESVHWASEASSLTAWTVIDVPDDEIERPIYAAQMQFMDRFPEIDCDFTVLYRFGKPQEQIRPSEGIPVPPQA